MNVDYEEDLQAEIMKQREEHEAALYKKFFQSRIKAMGWLKKIKHGALVFLIAAVVCGYFVVKRVMLNDIESTMNQSLAYYQTIASRNELLG